MHATKVAKTYDVQASMCQTSLSGLTIEQ